MCEETYVGCPRCGEPAEERMRGSGYVSVEETFSLCSDGTPDESIEMGESMEWPDDISYWCEECQDTYERLDEECVPEDCECAECSEDKDYVLDETVIFHVQPDPDLGPLWLKFMISPHYGERLRDDLLPWLDDAPPEVQRITRNRIEVETPIEGAERYEAIRDWLEAYVDEHDKFFNFYYKEEFSEQKQAA